MQNNLENQMNEIIELIYKTEEYITYKKAEEALNSEKELIARYHRVLSDYNEQKKYEKYIDISSIKQELKEVQKEMNSNAVIMHYYDSLRNLNNLLEELTGIVFDGLLDSSLIQPYFK